VLINAAAYTNVDGAETPEGREAAWAVNAQAVANLAHIAIKNEITLVHISTDYVFNGEHGLHKEDEALSPLSVYGATKAAGDIAVSLAPRHYLVRTSWVIGDGKNFVRTMLDLANKGINPSVVSDQIGRPTFTAELVRAVGDLLTTSAPYGTYNVSNDGEPVSWADLAKKIYEQADLNTKVTGISTKEYFAGKENIAPRPLQSTLNLSKIHKIGFKSHNWQDDLKTYLNKELKK
jgi:dTDP-4-dehydrorhamnose 3,5-epimerase